MVAHAVEEIRTAVGDGVEAVGFGIPCTFDARTGMAVQAVNLPLHDIRFADVMAERLGLPGGRRQRRQLRGAGRGARGGRRGLHARWSCSRSAPGSAAGCSWAARSTAAGSAAAPRWGTWSSTSTAGRARDCPNWGCLESVGSGTTLVRLASVAVAQRPDTALGRALEAGRELTGPMITELAREGDPVARDAIALIGRGSGSAS